MNNEHPAYLHPFAEMMRNYLLFRYEHDEDKRKGPKDFNRASAVGRDFYTNYHYRLGTEKTNHPTAEGLGKMAAGDVFHWFIQDLLEDMGIAKEREADSDIPELKVKGHLDNITGGVIDYDEAIGLCDETLEEWKNYLDEEIGTEPEKPAWFYKVKRDWLTALKSKYPDGLTGYVLDIKSLSAFRFASKEATGWQPDKEHAMQVVEYMMGRSDAPQNGLLLYVCRDDFRLAVVEVKRDEWEQKIVDYWTELNGFVERGEEPEIEPEITYDEDGWAHPNWHIVYSPYLTKMYPQYKTKEDFRELIEPRVKEINKQVAEDKMIAELNSKYSDEESKIARMLELYQLKKWSTTEYSCLKKLTGKTIQGGKIVDDKPKG
jgi:hypothetical protein